MFTPDNQPLYAIRTTQGMFFIAAKQIIHKILITVAAKILCFFLTPLSEYAIAHG